MSVGFLDRLPGQPLALLSRAFEHSPVAKAVVGLATDTLGELIEVNAAFAELLGYTRDELVGRSCLDLLTDADRVVVAAALAGGGSTAELGDRRFLRKDGTLVWAQVGGVRSDDGGHLVADLLDTTERHTLAESEAIFRDLFESAPIGLALAGPDGAWTRLNTAAAALLGSCDGQDLRGDLGALRSLTAGRAASHQMRKRYVRADGHAIWSRVTVTLRQDGGSEPTYLAQIVDVTAEDELRRREEQYRVAFDSGALPMAVADDRGCLLRVNEAFETMFGRRTADLVGHTLGEFTRPGRRATDEAGPVAVEPGGTASFERRCVRPDGSTVWTRITLTGVHGPAGETTWLVQCEDVTTRQQAEAAARDHAQPELTRTAEVVEVVEPETPAPSFAEIFGQSPLAKMVVGLRGAERGRILLANPALCELLGHTDEQAATLHVRETADPSIDPEPWLTSLASGGITRTVRRVRMRHRDGTLIPVTAHSSVLTDEHGPASVLIHLGDADGPLAENAPGHASEIEVTRLRSVLAVHRDLTAAPDRDAVLRVVAERAVALFEAADGAAVELLEGTELNYVTTAGTLAPFAGTRLPVDGSLSGMVATTDVLAGSADTSTDDRVNRATCAQLGITSMLVAPLHEVDRVIGCLQISASRPGAFDDLDEQHLALLAVSVASALRRVDDAARNAAALGALAASETRFRLAFENSPVGVTLVSLAGEDHGRYLYANPAMLAITGYSLEELNAMTFRQLLHPDDVAGAEAVLGRVVAGEASERIDRRYRHKQGHLVRVAVRVASVCDDQGKALYLVNQVEDVTTQRVAEAELQRQARLLELIPAAVIVRDLDGAIRWWNAGAERLYGWRLAAAAGRAGHRLLSTIFPDHGSAQDVADGLLRDGSWDGSLQQLTAHGRRVTVLSRQVLHQPEDGSPVQVLEINTDVTAARAAELALAESEQRFRAQFTHSAAGQVIQALDGSRAEVNPAYAAMLGYQPAQLAAIADTDLYHPDDQEAVSREVAALYAGEADSYTREGRLRHADGHWVDVSATVSIIRDEHGHPKSMIGVLTDVSARRAAEQARDRVAADLAERNTDLEAANKLKLDLIGMLGHEIGNPLSSIRGYTEVLVESGADLDPAYRDRAVAAIARQSGRLEEIVREVLAMVTLDAGTITAVRDRLDVRDQVQQALAAVDQPDLPVLGDGRPVLVNAGHLQQILVNLLSNATKYGGGATAIRISNDGDRVQVRVEDNGPGVPEEFRHRLFQRLARADRDATNVKGTGLGLYIVRGLAQANHGEIHHEPNPAGGSVFVLDLQPAD